jgi:hypothetical protein
MTPNVWRMGALPKMDEEIVSGSVQDFRIFPLWVLLMEVVIYVLKH